MGKAKNLDWDKLGREVPVLVDQGLNDGEIAEALGCSKSSIGKVRKRLGIPTKAKRKVHAATPEVAETVTETVTVEDDGATDGATDDVVTEDIPDGVVIRGAEEAGALSFLPAIEDIVDDIVEYGVDTSLVLDEVIEYCALKIKAFCTPDAESDTAVETLTRVSRSTDKGAHSAKALVCAYINDIKVSFDDSTLALAEVIRMCVEKRG